MVSTLGKPRPALLAAAAAAPDWDVVMVLVNDPVYGGSGGRVPVASTNSASDFVVVHELGHSFAGLADEYTSEGTGYPPCSDIIGPTCEANVTDVVARDELKWHAWLDPSTPVPTPQSSVYATSVGLFEGARHRAMGMYRPMLSCAMRDVLPFCPVCQQEWILALYRGGWGVPSRGIDPIEPGLEVPPPGTVTAPWGVPVTFNLSVLAPVGGPAPTIEWFLAGYPYATGEVRIEITAEPGRHWVYARVMDPTPLVHPAAAGGDLLSSRSWTLLVEEPRLRRRVRSLP